MALIDQTYFQKRLTAIPNLKEEVLKDLLEFYCGVSLLIGQCQESDCYEHCYYFRLKRMVCGYD